MGERGKILNFVFKDVKSSKNISVNKGEIVNLSDKMKIKEKDDLNVCLLDTTSYMIWLLEEIYNDIYDVKDEDFMSAAKDIHNAINELEDCYKKLENIDISNIDELIFKLKLMVGQSYYFVSLFNILDGGEDIDLFELKYYVSLSYLYVEYMNDVIRNKNFNYDDFNGVLETEEEELEEVITELEIRNKLEAYTTILTSKTEEKVGSLVNEVQIKFLSELISDTVENFIHFDVDVMLEYYNKVLDKYIDIGILNMTSLGAMEVKKLILELFKKIEKQYYYSYKIVDDFIIFTDKYVSEKEAINISNKFDKLFYLIDKMHTDGNFNGMSTIERTIKLIYDKIINMIDEEEEEKIRLKLEDIFSDEIILNSIYMISDDLLNGKIDNINKNCFDHMWSQCRSFNINKYLTNIIRREIFNNKDREFYSDSKYRDLIELEIKDISNNAYYACFDIEGEYIKDDFLKILEMLKKSFKLEEYVSSYKLFDILDDINKLDYLDYSYTTKYLDMLENVLDNCDDNVMSKYNDGKKFLEGRKKKRNEKK